MYYDGFVSTRMDSSRQTVSVTKLLRDARDIFEGLRQGRRAPIVVLRNNAPVPVLLSVKTFEALLNELDNLRLESAARKRLRSLGGVKSISHRAMMRRFTR
jgi:antitoxin StbD